VTGSLPAHEALPQGRTPALQGGEASLSNNTQSKKSIWNTRFIAGFLCWMPIRHPGPSFSVLVPDGYNLRSPTRTAQIQRHRQDTTRRDQGKRLDITKEGRCSLHHFGVRLPQFAVPLDFLMMAMSSFIFVARFLSSCSSFFLNRINFTSSPRTTSSIVRSTGLIWAKFRITISNTTPCRTREVLCQVKTAHLTCSLSQASRTNPYKRHVRQRGIRENKSVVGQLSN
jgi:hypothetical protein